MNSKGHLTYSVVKSIIRMLSCLQAIIFFESDVSFILLCIGFLTAEVLGIIEEVVDER